MNLIAGEKVILSATLSESCIKKSGQVVVVSIRDAETDSELLTDQLLVETSNPGTYEYEWTGAPQSRAVLLAIYTWKGCSSVEEIIISDKPQSIVVGALEAKTLEDTSDAIIADNVASASISDPLTSASLKENQSDIIEQQDSNSIGSNS